MASYSWNTNIDAKGSSTASDKYNLKLDVTITKNSGNSSTVSMVGYIKSNSSSYTAYNLSSGASNTLKIIDEDGTTQYNTSFKAKYDTRSTGNYYKVFTKSTTVNHGSDGARAIRFVWTFKETSISWSPQGTLYGPSSSSTTGLTTTTYTISYNANGGTGAPSAQTKTYGKTLTLSSTKPTRAASSNGTTYTFKGWATSETATSAQYSAGGSYTTNAAATLYAVWSSTSAYTVSYNANGGYGAPSAQTKTSGTNLTLSSTKPSRTGYTFAGWGTSADATSVKYAAGATYSTNADIILYAIWTAWTFTVAYNANGGSGAPSSQTKTANIAISLSDTEPTKSGYVFKCWNTKSDGTGTTYHPGNYFNVIQNGGTYTLYAIWITTDILIYNTGKCKAVEFVEGETNAFYNDGSVVATEFIEGTTFSMGSKAFKFTELIEK